MKTQSITKATKKITYVTRVLYLSTLFLILFTTVQADKITVTKRNGGEQGYDRITESHKTNIFSRTHSLICQDPGFSSCDWATLPTIIIDREGNTHPLHISNIESTVISYIVSGSHNGKFLLGQTNHWVIWSGDSPTSYTYTILEVEALNDLLSY